MHDNLQASTVLYHIIITQELQSCTTQLHCLDHRPILTTTTTTIVTVPQPHSQVVIHPMIIMGVVMGIIILEYGA